MKVKNVNAAAKAEAVEAVKSLENATGVKVQTGLRAGGGGKGGAGGGQEQPLYGVPNSST
ncbi:MAG: hypothetical protein ABMA64_38215 [Myxococcota bacterium]